MNATGQQLVSKQWTSDLRVPNRRKASLTRSTGTTSYGGPFQARSPF
jgi:hypothetical protein